MEITSDQQYLRSNRYRPECCIGLVVTGVLVTTLGIASAAVLPICYMFYAQQTALGFLYIITGVASYAVSPRASNFAAKSGVVMTLHILSWITTVYIFQVALNLITGSFYPDRELVVVECGFSDDYTDEILYYTFGGVSLLAGVIYLVFSPFVFAAFWKDKKPLSQMPGTYQVVQPTAVQLQHMSGYNNRGFVQEPVQVLHTPAYSADPRHNLPPYTPTPPVHSTAVQHTGHEQSGSVQHAALGSDQTALSTFPEI